MGIRLKRKKRRNIKLSLAYKLNRLLPISINKKLKLYLDLSWIFSRLAHELTSKSSIQIPYNPDEDFLLSKINNNDKVLDVGCGTGYVIGRLLSKTENIVAVDQQKKSIDIVKKKFGDKVEIVHDDIHNYLTNQQSVLFDVIVFSHVLEHIEEPEHFLQSITKLAKYIYVEVPDFEASHLNKYRYLLKTDLVYSDADHVSEFDRNGLKQIIEKSGFNIQDASYSHGVIRLWCSKKIE